MNDTSIRKLFGNPSWRIQNLYKIVNKNSKLILFKPNESQKVINESKNKRKIVLKARQHGITTNEVIKLLDKTVWNENKTTCILAHKQSVLDKIFNIVHTAYDKLPDSIKPKVDRGGGSKYELYFPESNSTIYTTLEVRGGTINDLLISEAAFIPLSRINATLQAVPIDTGMVTFESTPNGLNHFHDIWNDQENYIEKLFFPWFFHPEYRIETVPLVLSEDEEKLIAFSYARHGVVISHEQIAFRRYKIRELNGFKHFIQEYPEDDNSCFLSSGSNPFDLHILKNKIQSLPDSAGYIKNGQIRICKPVDRTKNYIIGADVAEGVNRDFSVGDVWCVEDREQVAQFRGQISPGDFGDVLAMMGKIYSAPGRMPMIIVERNNHGHAVILKLTETLNYPNLWRDSDERPGHRTTMLSRPILLDQFIQAVTDSVIKINFRETLSECLTLVDNNGKIEADDGKHDDCIIAAALALKGALDALARINLYKNIDKKIMV